MKVLFVEETALMSSKQGKCTLDCLSLAKPRFSKQGQNTNVSTVMNHFLVGSSYHTASHGSETWNGAVGDEYFCCWMQILQGTAIIKWVLNSKGQAFANWPITPGVFSHTNWELLGSIQLLLGWIWAVGESTQVLSSSQGTLTWSGFVPYMCALKKKSSISLWNS